ncbi:MAG TPA: hypothetical protein VK901_13070 [Nitrospiraceae bacterium]|nr:hypothetical protein [Nitrospiraceae bacterium]
MGNPSDYRIKLNGARSHLRNLEIEIHKWLREDHYNLIPEHDPNGGPNDWQIRMYADLSPPHWSAAIGDVLHNLRGALDHLVFALASTFSLHPLTKEITEKSEFPIYGDIRGEGVAAVEARYCGDMTRKLVGVPPAAKTLIKSLQPYHAGHAYVTNPLWILHELSNIDKHRLLLICSLSTRSVILNSMDFTKFQLTGGNAIYNARLKPDAVVARFSGTGDPMDVQFDPVLEVIFDSVPTVDGEGLIKTVQELFDYVNFEIIPPLSEFLEFH